MGRLIARDKLQGAFLHDMSDGAAQSDLIMRNRVLVVPQAQVLAAANQAEHVIVRADRAMTIVQVRYAADAGLTANDVNNKTLKVDKRDGAGGGAVSVVAFITNLAGGSFSAFQPKALTTVANISLAAGNILTVSTTEAGAGVTLPAGVWIVEYTED